MNASEVLREARNQLFERGWYQGSWQHATDGSVCMLSALRYAAFGSMSYSASSVTTEDAWHEAHAWLNDAIASPADKRTFMTSIASWNDNPDRTFDEVIDALELAEKISEEAQ